MKNEKTYNRYMGSQLVATGKTKSNLEYRIYNIDNIYTLYVKIREQLNPTSGIPEPLYSAFRSFPTLHEAKEYTTKNL